MQSIPWFLSAVKKTSSYFPPSPNFSSGEPENQQQSTFILIENSLENVADFYQYLLMQSVLVCIVYIYPEPSGWSILVATLLPQPGLSQAQGSSHLQIQYINGFS